MVRYGQGSSAGRVPDSAALPDTSYTASPCGGVLSLVTCSPATGKAGPVSELFARLSTDSCMHQGGGGALGRQAWTTSLARHARQGQEGAEEQAVPTQARDTVRHWRREPRCCKLDTGAHLWCRGPRVGHRARKPVSTQLHMQAGQMRGGARVHVCCEGWQCHLQEPRERGAGTACPQPSLCARAPSTLLGRSGPPAAAAAACQSAGGAGAGWRGRSRGRQGGRQGCALASQARAAMHDVVALPTPSTLAGRRRRLPPPQGRLTDFLKGFKGALNVASEQHAATAPPGASLAG